MAIYSPAISRPGNNAANYLGGRWRIVWHTTEGDTAEAASAPPDGQGLLVGFFRLRRSSGSLVQKAQVIVALGQVTTIILLLRIVARS
jgi:hypothetical protein